MKNRLTFILLSSKKDWIRYGYYSSIFAFLVGLYGYTVPLTREHYYFFIPASIAAYVVCSLMWHGTFKTKDDYKIGNVISVGLISMLIVHYFTFVLWGLGRTICYYLTGNCTDYTGKPENIPTVLSSSFVYALITVYEFGIITLPSGILISLFVMKTSPLNKKEI